MPSRRIKGAHDTAGRPRVKRVVPNVLAKVASLYRARPTFVVVTAATFVLVLVVVLAGRPSACAETVSIAFAVVYVPRYRSIIAAKGFDANHVCGRFAASARQAFADPRNDLWPAAASVTALQTPQNQHQLSIHTNTSIRTYRLPPSLARLQSQPSKRQAHRLRTSSRDPGSATLIEAAALPLSGLPILHGCSLTWKQAASAPCCLLASTSTKSTLAGTDAALPGKNRATILP